MKMTTNNVYMVKATLHELASHVYILATGLQNAAPPGPSPASINYLLEAAAELEQVSSNIENLLKTSSSIK
jgi:hypothetical protein